ncbi:uncharacterized protein [Amphiura filiformis]|uniref:uncharacterized protein isoform X2 n=1 Tax=Amphiura filiformis TaxID=82378 RepID=UPI003B20F1F7
MIGLNLSRLCIVPQNKACYNVNVTTSRMKSVLLVFLTLVALCHSKTIPWLKKQPAMVRKTAPETIPWVEKQPAMVRKTAPKTIPWFEKQPAMVRKTAPETIPWFEKQPAMVHKTAPESVPWLTKQPAIMIEAQDDIVCPDQISSCPASTTCCLMKDGFYGCCPSENAVCCDDQKHCCPSGYKCNPATYECFEENWSFEAMVQIPAKKSNFVLCPGNTAKCPVGSTCCMMGNNQYGCCPTPNAVCCADRVHCCPHNKICNASTSECMPRNANHRNQQLKFTSIEADNHAPSNIVCPGGQSSCPDGTTCCPLGSGKYGCCPYKEAVCCSDEEHCCPKGYTCNLEAGTCSKSDDQMEFLAVEESVTDVVCPDGASKCADGTTCCKTASGQYGCCPLPNAVCCSDGSHCCPSGYTCNVKEGTCTESGNQIGFLAVEEPVATVVCPDGTSQCPDGSTCCKMASGQYGCCPLPKAVCCSDNTHCCPSGYTCDVTAGTCKEADNQISLHVLEETVTNVVCPDGTSQCPDGSTCCKMASGQYGCCPLPKAVCCSDNTHCCPSGYTCDVTAGTCKEADNQIFLLVVEEPVATVVCPDGTSQCPDGSTCCKMASGQYGCCPLPKAVCCSDGSHCCPSGYTCDVTAGTCKEADNQISLQILEETVTNVVCPDGTSQCPDGSTCCKLASGQYDCCPLPKAVCCSDGSHCCPSGYTCDVTAGTCKEADNQISLHILEETVTNVVCPDGTSQCPDGSTCCKMASGQYGCCPLPKAVCCSDNTHCCPSGYTCDVAEGTCKEADNQISLHVLEETVTNVVCPDGTSQCPDGSTCCKMASGQYGCCPLPKAVCCSDNTHCCPSGYTCDVAEGTCKEADNQISLHVLEETVTDVVCPDGVSKCADGTTCCKTASGQYGCCPLPKAVCCSDGSHCCPSGYTCDVTAGTCTEPDNQISLLTVEGKVGDIVCPDKKSKCPKGSTCCLTASGQYGCCPFPNADCCSDGSHCCPSGYKCDVSAGTCTKTYDQTTALTLQDVVGDQEACGGGYTCPKDTTCCEMPTAKWGCCPFPNAVCCRDGQHCCPTGYQCDLSSESCVMSNGKKFLAFGEVIDASANVVTCPDQSQCQDGYTCCETTTAGQYACCPLPNAVCCSDGLHCCPNGNTCDVSTGTCLESAGDQVLLVAINSGENEVNNVQCDDETQCPTDNTCCKMPSGQWGCCPMPKAVCCDDGLHCCPNGYTCAPGGATCQKSNQPASVITSMELTGQFTRNGILCPDGEKQCPDYNTCCMLESGKYGCCPLEDAVCCDDKEHCCPKGYTCNEALGICTLSDEQVALKMLESAVTDVVCPGGTTSCPDGNTCCKLTSGQYGCCPLPNAVCCSDGQHCCPSGYTCDPTAGTCRESGGDQIFYLTVEEITPNIVCPDGQSECPKGNTCCKLTSGQYGCCPLPNAECCSDGQHCCPSGYTCDPEAGTCRESGGDQIFYLAVEEITPNEVCPGGTTECPDGSTCCKLSTGQWGCCPLPNAVCCSDGLHCCPNGYTCDLSAGTCTKSYDEIHLVAVDETSPNHICPDNTSFCPISTTCCKDNNGGPTMLCCADYDYVCCSNGCCPKDDLVSLVVLEAVLTNVVCPDGLSECQDGQTCCQLKSGDWGCCPYADAVCCSDQEHCCPNGYTCDVSSCKSKILMTRMISSYSEQDDIVNSVTCPDGTSICREGDTCCEINGLWGCCPLPNAVCCEDETHCCPEGFTCDVSGGYCSKSSSLITMESSSELQSVQCSDHESVCPDGSTCCKLTTGQYGCCPSPNAVCCSDGVHCCPEGYTCDPTAGKCRESGSDQIFYLAVEEITPNIVCPDGQSECPKGNTCCKLTSGQYGCCPLPNAECCSDGQHCCPSGYTCDPSAGTCKESGGNQILYLAVEEITPNIVCPDGQSECPKGNTCCKLTSGQYGCCPLPNAECCSDGQHCCPSGYTCDPSAGTCKESGGDQIFYLTVEEMNPNVICPGGGSECPDGNTCCELTSGQWGCCPLPNAVCCDDKTHCCPQGTTCGTGGFCNKQSDSTLTEMALIVDELKATVVCPGGTMSCPTGNTCCMLASGQYGCCPLPNAVCCDDKTHCCPQGTTCSTGGFCTKQSDSTLTEIALIVDEGAVGNVVCPGGQYTCPTSNTCCKLPTGSYGCCPLPNAVCCSDGLHCCPEGHTCDVGSAKCNSGLDVIPFLRKVPAKPISSESNVDFVQIEDIDKPIF